ncbi:S-layer homology domain-containing protein [Brevibacillus borstelensis]|uniref:S-layer homology domain-containing protein n=1 Tax=Brevibacillus borstelensis TaxID=45462 RepID=UPI0030C23996
MRKRHSLFLLIVAFLLQSVFAVKPSAAETYYDDIKGHWAEKEIRFLEQRGILKHGGNRNFNPDRMVSRGEAMALVNRVLEDVYGRLAKPVSQPYLDHRYPLKTEIEGLVANMQVLLDVNTGFVNDYRPGDRMVFNLHLASNGLLMKKPQTSYPDWWMPTPYLQYPLSREEASMILFYVLSPYKLRITDPKINDVRLFYDGYFQWKQKSSYVDTASPYAEAIREFKLFGGQRNFDPYSNMTRGQFAVVLTRLHQFWEGDGSQQFNESARRQQIAASLLLTAANRAFLDKDQERLSSYVSESAIESLTRQNADLPLHDYGAVLEVKKDENNTDKLWVTGKYEQRQVGPYELEFLFEKDDSNPFGQKITSIVFRER